MNSQRSGASTSGPDGEEPLPRWVTVFLIAAVVALLLVVVVLILSGDDHGPQRHQPGGDQAIQTPEVRIPPVDHG